MVLWCCFGLQAFSSGLSTLDEVLSMRTRADWVQAQPVR
jgi:hypothetical protein